MKNQDRNYQAGMLGKIIGVLLVLVMLLGVTLTLIDTSKAMNLKAEKSAELINLSELPSIYSGLYFRAMSQAADETLTLEMLVGSQEGTVDSNEEANLRDRISYYMNRIDYGDYIEYVVTDNKTGKILLSKGDGKLISPSAVRKNPGNYIFSAQVTFDADSAMSVNDSFGISNTDLVKSYESYRLGNHYGLSAYIGSPSQEENYTYYSVKEPQDVTMTIAVNQKIFDGVSKYGAGYFDYIEYNEYFLLDSNGQQFTEGFLLLLLGMLGILVSVAVILFLIRPFGIGTGMLSNIPVELTGCAGIVLIFATKLMWIVTQCHLNGVILSRLLDHNFPEHMASFFDQAAIYGGWFLYFFAVYACLISLLVVFKKGFRRYCLENTIALRFCAYVYRNGKKGINAIKVFDFQEPVNQAVLKIVGINFILIAGMCVIWFFGLPVLVLYSIILFYVLRRYLTKIKNQYESVLYAARNMAQGNLEMTYTGDAGVFTTLVTELERVNHGFKHAVEEEVKSQQMRTELITNVSHDLKTPLTAIITYVDLLKDENLTKEQREEYIQTLDRKALRLKQLIEDLFEVSKINSNSVVLNPVRMDLVGLIKQVQLELSDRFDESEITFRLQAPQEKVYVCLDSQKTFRIFENLFVNIVKYAQPQTRAYLDLSYDQNQVVIELKNVSAHELNLNANELSERFVRGDQSRTTEGSGLGLAIVKSLVEKQGGSFTIKVDGDLFKVIVRFERDLTNPDDEKDMDAMEHTEL